ncbi:Hypothetical protein, putative, partial [Bodo saltans]
MSHTIVHGLVVPGHYFPLAYALIVGTGLVMALVLGMRLHFTEIVKTHCKTPEYWPSISATTGDFAPERFVWRGAFVLAAMFRFTSGFLSFKFFAQQDVASAATRAAGLVSTRVLVYAALVCELLRCVSAMGWTVISSGEDNLHHNASFAVYMIVGFVLQVSQVVIVGRVRGTYANGSMSMSVKKVCLIGQTICALCVGFFYVRHHQTCAPGAYSRSTMCEWMFALFNVLFDASQGFELQNERVSFGVSGGEPHVLKLASVPSNAVMMVSDVFFSYFTVASVLQLFQAVYFVPMVAMEFTWEAVLLVGIASPLLLFSARIRRALHHQKIAGAHLYVYLYVVAVLSLFCFDYRKGNPGTKILLVSPGAVCSFLALFCRMYLHNDNGHVFSLPHGFVVSMALRAMFASVDPIYTSAIYNAFLGIVFGLWCAWIQYRRSAYAPTHASLSSLEDSKSPAAAHVAPAAASAGLIGVAFGSCFSLSLVMVSSPSFVARLVAVDPWPSSMLVILAFLLGLFFSATVIPFGQPRRSVRNAPVLVALFVIGFLVLYLGTRQSNRTFEKQHAHYPITYETAREHVKLADWTTEVDFSGSPYLAFCGGLAIVFALGACWPVITAALASTRHRHYTHRAGTSIEAVYPAVIITFLVMHVYVVCFPFVPFGWVLRDRLMSCCAFRSLRSCRQHYWCGQPLGAPGNSTIYAPEPLLRTRGREVVDLCRKLQYVQLSLNKLDDPSLTNAQRISARATSDEALEQVHEQAQKTVGDEVLSAAEALTYVSGMIWTIHTGIDDYNTDGLDRMVMKIKETKAGIIGLLESDAIRVHNGNRDVVEYFSYHLGFDHTDYGPTTFDGTFGCALITKYPILYTRRYVLPSPLGELACLIHAKLDLFGVETNVYVGHWGNTQHWADGVLQSEFLGELVQ